MGPQGLVFAYGNHAGRAAAYGLGALQTAQISGAGERRSGRGAGLDRCGDLALYRRRSAKTGFDDIIAFGPAGVYVSMGQDPATHDGEPFGQLYLAMADFGSNQGWSVGQTPRLVGDVTGDGIPDIVGFGTNSTFVAVGSRDSSGNLQFKVDPTKTIGDFGAAEGWSGSNRRPCAPSAPSRAPRQQRPLRPDPQRRLQYAGLALHLTGFMRSGRDGSAALEPAQDC